MCVYVRPCVTRSRCGRWNEVLIPAPLQCSALSGLMDMPHGWQKAGVAQAYFSMAVTKALSLKLVYLPLFTFPLWFKISLKKKEKNLQTSIIRRGFLAVCSEEESVDSSLQSFNPYWFVFHAVSSNGAQHRGAPHSTVRHGMALPCKSLLARVCLCVKQKERERL